ncbi:MAG TPA: hypothetical protein VGO07_03315 [Candidatus Saccharimonadales bacterium]|jgi:hypothetical protein|nr:hypothetical protein [Candidatus Saccharimonadales bacterium]
MAHSHAAPEDPITLSAAAEYAGFALQNEELVTAERVAHNDGGGRHRAAAEVAVGGAVEADSEVKRYARHRRPDDEAAEQAAPVAADVAKDETAAKVADTVEAPSTLVELLPPPPDELLADMRKVVHEHASEPQIKEQVGTIRKESEPNGGYFAIYTEAIAGDGLKTRRAMGEAARAAALAKPPEARTDFDDFILSQNEATHGQTRDPRHSYYRAERRVVDELRDGHMPAEFRDVESLEQAVAYMVEAGLADLPDRRNWRRSVLLMDAGAALREATLRVPDFNPTRAGLFRLYDRSILMKAALRAESSHWGRNRSEHGSSVDWMAGMVGSMLDNAEDTIATIHLQNRAELLAPDAISTDEQ